MVETTKLLLVSCGGTTALRGREGNNASERIPLSGGPPAAASLLMCFGSAFMRAPCGRSQRWEQPHCWNVLLALGEHAGCHALSSLPGLSSQFAVTQKQRHLAGNVRMDTGIYAVISLPPFCVILHSKVSLLHILKCCFFYSLLPVKCELSTCLCSFVT